MSTIAFIGLGNMGGPMAANLVKAGHTVRGFDVVEAAQQQARDAGVEVCDTAASAATGADQVITMLPNGALVHQVLGEVLGAAADNTLIIDCSTIAVDDARAAADMCKDAGKRFIDAPVSGGIAGASAGTLAFMVGGADSDVAEAAPLFEVMGRASTHCGEVGAGQAAKVCNNMVLAVHQIAIAEAAVLAEKLGLSAQAMFDVISTSTGASWALTTNCPVPGPVPTSPANNDFKPGFATALMAKDLGLAMAALESTGVDAKFGRAAHEAYQAFIEADAANAGLDFSAIIKTVGQ